MGALLGGCGGAPADDRLRPRWQQVAVPVPAGQRLAVRDVLGCGGRAYLVGALTDAAGAATPAVFASADARTWTPVGVSPATFYGRRNELRAAGCRDGRLAAVGSASGGVHGNPRVSAWRQREDGSLAELTAQFELYGGPDAVNVARVAGGPAGWLLVGNRVSGAAVWRSADAAAFELVERAAGLATGPAGVTWATDAVAAGAGWLVVGSVTAPGRADRDPAVWRSTDGLRWSPVQVPGSGGYDELQRVVATAGGPVAVGPHGAGGFGVWRAGPAGRWVAAGRFGGGSAPGAVSALAVAPDAVLALVGDTAAYALWSSAGNADGAWRPVAVPVAMPAGGDRAAGVAAVPGGVVLFIDEGTGTRLWWTDAVTAG